MKDEIIVDRPSNDYGIPGISWVNYLSSPAMRVQVMHEGQTISRMFIDPTINPNSVDHVRKMLQRAARFARLICNELGIDARYPSISYDVAVHYLSRWKACSEYMLERDRIAREKEATEPEEITPPWYYAPSPMIERAREDVQRVAKRYEAAPSLYEYRNAYGEPARMFQL